MMVAKKRAHDKYILVNANDNEVYSFGNGTSSQSSQCLSGLE